MLTDLRNFKQKVNILTCTYRREAQTGFNFELQRRAISSELMSSLIEPARNGRAVDCND